MKRVKQIGTIILTATMILGNGILANASETIDKGTYSGHTNDRLNSTITINKSSPYKYYSVSYT